jgi:hypothetical protein
MTITVIVFCVFVFLSFLSTIVILSALVSSSRNVHWDERTKRWMNPAGKPEPVRTSELRRETISVR